MTAKPALASRKTKNTGSEDDGLLPANVLIATVSALPATVATSVPLSIPIPNATAASANIDGVMLLALPIGAPPSASTLPLASANVAMCPAADDPGPVTFPLPTGGWVPAAAGEFVSTIFQSACVPEPPVATTFT